MGTAQGFLCQALFFLHHGLNNYCLALYNVYKITKYTVFIKPSRMHIFVIVSVIICIHIYFIRAEK